jgi:hypothetical protein
MLAFVHIFKFVREIFDFTHLNNPKYLMEKSEKLRILRIELFYYLEGPEKMTGDELIELFK